MKTVIGDSLFQNDPLPMSRASGSPQLQSKNRRLHRRLLKHHMPLFLLSAGAVVCIYLKCPYSDGIMRFSIATAYPALIFLVTSLAIGPLNVLLRRRDPISVDLRRDVGIWAGILAMAHTAIGQNVHLRGRPWLYYVYQRSERHAFPIRHDVFGMSNYSGALCTLLVVLLLTTSNDWSLRKLGAAQWKKLQRWNYAALALLAIHALGYEEGVEHKELPWLTITLAALGLALVLQLCGFALRRKRGWYASPAARTEAVSE